MQFNHPLSAGLVASGKQLHGYSGITLSPLHDYSPIKKGLLVCHKNQGVSNKQCAAIENVTFLDDDQVENTQVGVNDATADRLALALASSTGTVAGVALAEQQAHTAVGEHTLLHGEALLVISPADAHHITLETTAQD